MAPTEQTLLHWKEIVQEHYWFGIHEHRFVIKSYIILVTRHNDLHLHGHVENHYFLWYVCIYVCMYVRGYLCMGVCMCMYV